MRGLILLAALLVAGCAGISNQTATITVPDAPAPYVVCAHRGALVQFERTADTTRITVDDRGHPAQPGWFSNLLTLVGARMVQGED